MSIWKTIQTTVKGWWDGLFKNEAQEVFRIRTIASPAMERALREWADTYQGRPAWADGDVKSYNFAKKFCSETARLTTLALGIRVEGSARACWLQKQMASFVKHMTQEQCEYACALGYLVIKPNGSGLDFVKPLDFLPTSAGADGGIDGGVFFDRFHEPGSSFWYTRLEWHRFETAPGSEEKLCRISSRIFRAKEAGALGEPVPAANTVWAGLLEDVCIANVDRPLFAVFRMPSANHIDLDSPLGCSVFANAMQELKELDIANSRLSDEIYDSQKQIFLGDMLVADPGKPVRSHIGAEGVLDKTGQRMPRYVRILPGSDLGDEYHEINPVLQTAERLKGIDHFLNLAGVKCGYSAGQFVLDGRTGAVTATQVEADDRETIQLIKQIRDSLRTAGDELLYALDKYADLYEITPPGPYAAHYDFGDITYSYEEDRDRHWQYVQAGKYPLWRYYVKFEGMGEEEARQVAAEAKEEAGKAPAEAKEETGKAPAEAKGEAGEEAGKAAAEAD